MANNFLQNLILFKNLTEEELKKINQIIEQTNYNRNETVFIEGDPGDAFYIILEGLIKVFKTTEQGRDKTLALLGTGDFFGEMSLLEGKERSASVKALQSTQLYFIERSKFKKLLKDYPEIAFKIIAILSERLREANNQIQQLTFSSVEERLEQKLRELAKKHGWEGKSGVVLPKKITHQELANLIGSSRVTVTKLLNKLKEEEKIIIKERYLILPQNDLLEDSQNEDK